MTRREPVDRVGPRVPGVDRRFAADLRARDLRMALLAAAAALLLAALAPLASRAHEGHEDAPGTEDATVTAGPIRITEEARRNIELRTEEAALRPIEKVLDTIGSIQAIPERSGAVSSRIVGRVTRLFADQGETVSAGQAMAEIESRQLGQPPPRVVYRAPIAGIVTDRHVVVGDGVEPDRHLFEIADLGEVYAAAQVFGSEIAVIRKGEKVRVRVDSFPESIFEGTIERIAGAVDPAKGSLQVFARIANPEQRLRPGMRATISVVTDAAGLAITVPKSALLGDFGSTFVFVQEKDPLTFERRSVQLGLTDDRYQEIVEGVTPGEKVVVQGNYQLQYVAPSAPSEHGDKIGDKIGDESGDARGRPHPPEGSDRGAWRKPWLLAGLAAIALGVIAWALRRSRLTGTHAGSGR